MKGGVGMSADLSRHQRLRTGLATTVALVGQTLDNPTSSNDSGHTEVQASTAAASLVEPATYNLLCGDVLEQLDVLAGQRFQLIISSPPYNIGKDYEKDSKRTLVEYAEWHRRIIAKMVDLLEDDGSICWQVGSFVRGGVYVPLDIILYPIFADLGLNLRNRIVWRFNFGHNSERKLSGRYETLLWFSKSNDYKFNLDAVRVPQLYPGKRHSSSKGEGKAGKPSGNPLGKNPSDFWEFSAQRDFLENPVWDLPNVKAKHPEKTTHTCQFPIELAERCILAFTDPGDSVLDPFIGVGSSAIAALKHGRLATGIDREQAFLSIAEERLKALGDGTLKMRPSGLAVRRPGPTERVAQVPQEWIAADGGVGK